MNNLKFVYIETYGCSANQNNSEIMSGILKQAGLDLVSSPEIADVVILNTCIVKGQTEQKIMFRIKELAKKYPSKILIIAGCMPDVHSSLIRQISPSVLLIGSHHVKDVAKLLRKFIDKKETGNFFSFANEEKLNMPKISQNKTIGITQILEGCLGSCSYCITRFAKGKLFSYSEKNILENISKDLKNGCKEVWLTSQDNAAYGLEKGKNKLIELLNNILSIEGKFKIRLGMMNANHVFPITDELIECYKNEKMYKFLHLPLQSGSDKVLRDMNRKYSVADFLMIVEKFRKKFPDISISTDIIVGYPTETGNDFKQTLEIIKKIKPQILNVSRFYGHRGTPAALLKKLPDREINKRSKILSNLHSKIALSENKKFENKELEVLVNKKGFGKTWLARTDNYRLVALQSEKNLLGKFLKVRVKKVSENYLIGELI